METDVTEDVVIVVSRRIRRILGWSLIFIGIAGAVVFFSEGSPKLLFAAFVLLSLGVHCIISSRTVNKIVVGNSSIKFLPVGAELHFSEIERMFVPGWADRFDTPPSALATLTFETNTDKTRYVPGAILQWKNRCQINFHGGDGNKMLKALRRHIPE